MSAMVLGILDASRIRGCCIVRRETILPTIGRLASKRLVRVKKIIGFGAQPVWQLSYHLWFLTMLLQGVHDLRNHVHVDVLTPKDVKMFVALQAANVKMVLGKLIAHRIDVDERIDVTIKDDDVRRDIASGELGWAVPRAGALVVGAKGGCV